MREVRPTSAGGCQRISGAPAEAPVGWSVGVVGVDALMGTLCSSAARAGDGHGGRAAGGGGGRRPGGARPRCSAAGRAAGGGPAGGGRGRGGGRGGGGA